jgi:hypothetical protein
MISLTTLTVALVWVALFLSALVYVTVSMNELAMNQCLVKHSYDVCFTTLN